MFWLIFLVPVFCSVKRWHDIKQILKTLQVLQSHNSNSLVKKGETGSCCVVCVLSLPLDFLKSEGRKNVMSRMCKWSIFREMGKNMIAVKANSISLS